MPFQDLDAAWADFKAETKLTELLGDDAAADHYLRIIFSAGAVAGLAVVTAHVAEGDDTISLTLLIAQLMAASDLIHADMTRVTGGAPPATDQTLTALQRLASAPIPRLRPRPRRVTPPPIDPQLLDDTRKLLGKPPYNSPANFCWNDNYFAKSLTDRWGERACEAARKAVELEK